MLRESISAKTGLVAGLILLLLLPGLVTSYHTGIGGEQSNAGETIDDVAKEGCLCHNGDSDNSIQIILDDVPFGWIGGETYTMHLQIIGGPEATGVYTAGFAMRSSTGVLGGEDVQNWEEESDSLTHTNSGSKTDDRTWNLAWTAPETGTGPAEFWIAGNTVNGDGIPSELDRWNRLTLTIGEGEDNGKTRTVFSGNGEITPPAPAETHVDLHHMGAALRAHWLGLLGFFAVIIVIIFCGFFLRYGFSANYTGRSNLLRLRIKHERRGDQI